MYTTTRIKHHRTNFLDSLAHESGRCYSKVVSLVRKTHAKKGFWLSKNDVQKYLRLRGYCLHSQSVQACADSYFDALDAYFQVRKVNPDAKPPKRTPKHFKVRWKSTAIRHKDGKLIHPIPGAQQAQHAFDNAPTICYTNLENPETSKIG